MIEFLKVYVRYTDWNIWIWKSYKI